MNLKIINSSSISIFEKNDSSTEAVKIIRPCKRKTIDGTINKLRLSSEMKSKLSELTDKCKYAMDNSQ